MSMNDNDVRYVAFARLIYQHKPIADDAARTAFIDALHKLQIPTFPTHLSSKVPLAGTHGLNSADTDRRRLARATTVPASRRAILTGACNWGIPTGSRSGLIALDIDDIDVIPALVDALPSEHRHLFVRFLASSVLISSPSHGHLHVWLPAPADREVRLRLRSEFATCEIKGERTQLTAPFSVRGDDLYLPVPRKAPVVAMALGLERSAVSQDWLDRGVVTGTATSRLLDMLAPLAAPRVEIDPSELTAAIEVGSSLTEDQVLAAFERKLRWWRNELRDGHDKAAWQLARRALVAVRVGVIRSEEGKRRLLELFPSETSYRWSNNTPGVYTFNLAQKLRYQAGAVGALDDEALTQEWALTVRSLVRSRPRRSHRGVHHARVGATDRDEEPSVVSTGAHSISSAPRLR